MPYAPRRFEHHYKQKEHNSPAIYLSDLSFADDRPRTTPPPTQKTDASSLP
jgi:hypothetical protein